MSTIGSRIDEVGTLLPDGAGFVLRLDRGGRYRLDLRRVPVDQVEKRVRVVGTLVDRELVDFDGIASV